MSKGKSSDKNVMNRLVRAIKLPSSWIYGAVILLAAWMLLVEPFWLETTRTTIRTNKVRHSYRIVVIADIQTARLCNGQE